MQIETVGELAEQIADWLGIYGSCKKENPLDGDEECPYNKNSPFCCRTGFVAMISERMIEAVENEKKLEKLWKNT